MKAAYHSDPRCERRIITSADRPPVMECLCETRLGDMPDFLKKIALWRPEV